MNRTAVVVIGGGQAGLAASHCLSELQIDHVVLERGRVAQSWRSERWDSLRLLSPSWQSRLPGWSYTGDAPDGFMSMPEVTDYLQGYANTLEAPVREHTSVLSVDSVSTGFRVTTDRGVWMTRAVIIATGACGTPRIPRLSWELSPTLTQTSPTLYRRPSSLPDGGVLIVGASASGIQLADELNRAGRDVTLAVGRHTRLPRRYRGRDIMFWLDAIGTLSALVDPDEGRATDATSLQLVGRSDNASLDLPALAARGVRLVGRAVRASGQRIEFDGHLASRIARADARLIRLRQRIDTYIEGFSLAALPANDLSLDPRLASPGLSLDLESAGIKSIIWATGFRRSYPWLNVPATDEHGELRHRFGVTEVPGLYALGLPLQRSRISTSIDGVGADATFITNHLAQTFGARTLAA